MGRSGWTLTSKEHAPPGARYMVFDCVYVNAHALFSRPLEERRHILQELRQALACNAVKLTESFAAPQSRRPMEACAAMGLEGVIMKRKGSLYRPGYRSTDWIKVPRILPYLFGLRSCALEANVIWRALWKRSARGF